MPKKDLILSNVWDTLIELPIEYQVNGQPFCLFPPSLGSTMLINRAIDKGMSQEDLVYEMLAICSFENRADAVKCSVLNSRINELKQASVEELLPIYMMFSEWGQDQEKFTKYYHLDVEQRYMQRAHQAKDHYGWTMEYVVWGISLINLNMLMADKVVSVYLSKEESRKAAVPQNRNIVKMDGQMTKEQLRAILGK